MSSYVLSIDQGTSSTRCMIFDSEGQVVSSHQCEHQQYYPSPGFVEHNPLEIWSNTVKCIKEAVKHIKSNKIAAIGITNQRETTCIWNKKTGLLYHNAIVWNDNRTMDICQKLSNEHELGKDRWREKTGLPLASYFSMSKIMYLLETIPGLYNDAVNGDALFGTIDTWLIWKLTNGAVHATDVTNASRTLLMNIKTLQWDKDILASTKIPTAMLPTILSSSEVYGHVTSNELKEIKDVPISGVLGDQHAALFGQNCYNPGEAKCTYGTGAFLLMNTGTKLVPSTQGLLTTVAYQLGKHSPPVYALEGAVAYSGSLIQWLRDNLEILPSADRSEEYANKVNDNGGVYFVPAFAGLYAPYWRDDARGIIAGLTAYNTKYHIVRAALEATAFQTTEVLQAMSRDASDVPLLSLKVDGGMTKNNLLMQYQSDLINVPLACPVIAETTALGAAFAAGLAVGYWPSPDKLRSVWKLRAGWTPNMSSNQRSTLLLHWQKALVRTLHWTSNNTSDPYLSSLPNGSNSNNSIVGKGVKLFGRINIPSLVLGLAIGTLGIGSYFSWKQRK